MRQRLSTKFIIGFLLAGTAGFLIVSVFISKITYDAMVKNEATILYRQAMEIAADFSNSPYASADYADKDINKQMRIISDYLNSDIMFITPNGSILLDTEGCSGVIEEFDPAISGNSYYFTGNFYNTFDEEMLTVMAPITSQFYVRGYVLIHRSVAKLESLSNRLFNFNYYTFLIMLLLFGILISMYIVDVCLPVRKLMSVTKSYAEGDFAARVNTKRRDELGRLSDSLDYMAGEIEKLNDYQSKFIANISHDFRSPLTSIKGYLEAMIDGTIPPEMYDKYLNIVLTETERLTKLTNNLLALNNMNQGMLLETTAFDINDTIKNTILTFEGTCSQKKIKFNLTFSSKTAYVMGDFGKIQQVIYNLIDNAIKFSNPNSYINISTYERGEKIFVSVKDFGIGIPKESLNKIWDRFYKSDLSRGKDKKGTGLGLSIVKEIINAHNTTIDVISTVGSGTEFIFSLPMKKDN